MSILVVGAGGRVGSAVVARLIARNAPVVKVYSKWSGVVARDDSWTIDVRQADQLQRIFFQPTPITQIYYCASRPPDVHGDEARAQARIQGVATVCEVFKDVSLVYCSSRLADTDTPYGRAQAKCEAIVTAHGGRFVRFPALYSATSRPWLRWVKWVYPAWSVDEAATAVLEATP